MAMAYDLIVKNGTVVDGREAMPEQVWIDALRYSGFEGPVMNPILHGTGADSSPPNAYEQGFFVTRRKFRANRQPFGNSGSGHPADGDKAGLVALAGDSNHCVVEIDILRIEIYQLRQTQSRRVKELEYRAIPDRHRVVALDLEQARHLIDVQRIRKFAGHLRR